MCKFCSDFNEMRYRKNIFHGCGFWKKENKFHLKVFTFKNRRVYFLCFNLNHMFMVYTGMKIVMG